MSDHRHLWHLDTACVVRCAEQGCQAEPDELEAAEAIAWAEARTASRAVLDWTPRP